LSARSISASCWPAASSRSFWVDDSWPSAAVSCSPRCWKAVGAQRLAVGGQAGAELGRLLGRLLAQRVQALAGRVDQGVEPLPELADRAGDLVAQLAGAGAELGAEVGGLALGFLAQRAELLAQHSLGALVGLGGGIEPARDRR
jgi:hypothetical protein